MQKAFLSEIRIEACRDILYGMPMSKETEIIIIIDNFCVALFSDVHKLTAIYNILQHFLSLTNVIYIIMTTNDV